MTDASAKTLIRAWLHELLDQPEYQHAFPVEINVLANNRVEVFIDSDTQVDFALCRKISRHLEEHLDEGQRLGERYTLEVSSPGVTRPLTLPRQFTKHLGRTLAVKVADGSTVTGELKAASEESLTLSEDVVRKEGKKKIKETLVHEVPFEDLRGAVVQVSFR